ncbi:hypothetical protein D3C80_1009330 [compost metagenome]
MSTVVFKTKSEPFAKNEVVFPVIAIKVFPNLFNKGTRTLISGLFPLLEMQIMTSSF